MNSEDRWQRYIDTTIALGHILTFQIWTINMNVPEHLLGHVSPILETIALFFFKWAVMLFLSKFITFLKYKFF